MLSAALWSAAFCTAVDKKEGSTGVRDTIAQTKGPDGFVMNTLLIDSWDTIPKAEPPTQVVAVC
jgi:hypothetical protein